MNGRGSLGGLDRTEMRWGEGDVGHEPRPARIEGVLTVPVAVTGGRGEARE